MMICPCGHSAPLPETSGRYVCSVCKRVLELNWFEGPNAMKKYEQWFIKARIFGKSPTERPRVEFIAAEERQK